MTSVRWIGFDVDECVGSFSLLWPYCERSIHGMDAPRRRAFLREMARAVSESPTLWMVRPGLDRLLQRILKAYDAGQITGCFLLSNNGSLCVIECVREILNHRFWKLRGFTGSPEDPATALVRAAWHRYAPCRKNRINKTWEQVVHCLQSRHLPPPSSTDDLLFYDDLEHVMAHEITHYVKVKPYTNYTPHAHVFEAVTPVLRAFGISEKRIADMYRVGESTVREDKRGYDYTYTSPNTHVSYTDEFERGLDAFVGTVGGRRRGSQTRRCRRKRTATLKQLWHKY